MAVGFNKPLYILPFDHRGSFQTKMFGWKGPLSAEQTAQIAAAKQVIYDALKAAVAGGVPKEKAGILVDEQFGAAILRDAVKQGYITACPAEKSGQDEFDFEYGEDFARHIEAFNPTFCKVLVRYNPEGDKALNQRQVKRLKRLSDYLRQSGRLFMFELLVPPEPAQLKRGAYGPGARGVAGCEHRAGRVEDRGTRSPPGLREGSGGGPSRRPRPGRLHRAGPRRGRQEGPGMASNRGARAWLYRLRCGPDHVLGPAGRLAGSEDDTRAGGQGDCPAVPAVGGRARKGARRVIFTRVGLQTRDGLCGCRYQTAAVPAG